MFVFIFEAFEKPNGSSTSWNFYKESQKLGHKVKLLIITFFNLYVVLGSTRSLVINIAISCFNFIGLINRPFSF